MHKLEIVVRDKFQKFERRDHDLQRTQYLKRCEKFVFNVLLRAKMPGLGGDEELTPKVRELITRVLDFLSHASNETLCAFIAGLGAITYFVLGRIGLVLIGVVGGVILNATWEGGDGSNDQHKAQELKRRKEVGLDIVKRLLSSRDQFYLPESVDRADKSDVDVKLSALKELDFEDFRPETRSALMSLVDAVIRDYVKWWYSPILPSDESFPFACRQILMGFILAVSSHLSRKRPADAFLDFLTNSTSIFIVFLSELSNALMASGLPEADSATRIQQYIEQNADSNLANVLNRAQQDKKFKAVADDVLQTFLDSKTYNCEPAKVFLREILASVILESILKTCSKPEWVNGWIVYLLEEGEPDLINAIDVGVGGTATSEGLKASGSQSLNQSSNQATAASSLPVVISGEAINKQKRSSKAEDAMEQAMLEAKRLTDLIVAEEAKKSQPPEDYGSSGPPTEPIVTPTSSHSESMAMSHGLDVADDEAYEPPPVHTEAPLAVQQASSPFTTFDQILPPGYSNPDPPRPLLLTLHNAKISIFDDAQPGEKASIRAKPAIDYLLQVEPASPHHPGWMIARKYSDFETLHEVLRRISVISGVPEFTKKYGSIPSWKNHTKASFRLELESYLRAALSHSRLAESEGMKRFLEKDQALGKLSGFKGVLGFPSPEAFQNMGKGMLDVLASAPKGAAGGGKALLEGVSGVFGGPKRSNTNARPRNSSRSESRGSTSRTIDERARNSSRSGSVSSMNRVSEDRSTSTFYDSTNTPQEGTRNSMHVSTELQRPQLPSRPSGDVFERRNALRRLSEGQGDNFDSQDSSLVDLSLPLEPSHVLLDENIELSMNLPPPPSEMTDDYGSIRSSSKAAALAEHVQRYSSVADLLHTSQANDEKPRLQVSRESQSTGSSTKDGKRKSENYSSLTTQETKVAVELLFAVINELYSLSSAWNIRLTLLNAAKTFLLRPGNPSLEAIRRLLQDTVLESNTSDAGLAGHLTKLRENSLPTEEELAKWPAPLSSEEQEKLRVKARMLLIAKGIPNALTSVMGASASGEALGRVFDSLQVEEISRGLIFAMLLQGIRAMTH